MKVLIIMLILTVLTVEKHQTSIILWNSSFPPSYVDGYHNLRSSKNPYFNLLEANKEGFLKVSKLKNQSLDVKIHRSFMNMSPVPMPLRQNM